MDLNKLQIFTAVYQRGNTASAAEALNVTRSAVSQNISKLEKQLGTSLFTRLPKGLVATPIAHELAKNISPLLTQINNEVNGIMAHRQAHSGSLHIGAPTTTGTVHMPRIIEGFCKNYANIEIKLTLEYSNELIAKTLAGELDLALIDVFAGVNMQREFNTLCHRQTLLKEQVILVCSADYFEQHIKDDLSYENLAKQQFMSITKDFIETKSWFYHQFKKAPDYLNKRLHTTSGVALLDCASKGVGMVVTGNSVVQDLLDQGKLVAVNPVNPGEENLISLIQLLDKKPTTIEKDFITHLTQYARHYW